MRINKYISLTGVCSRRQADQWIEEKRVTINGKIATIGQVVGPNDKVCLDKKPLKQKKNDIYIILNKPVGITCTTERHVKGNIIDFINHSERIFPVGRLDKDSEGLIILTNDGDIVNKILRQENNNKKEYIVTVNKKITPSFIKNMSKGVKIFNPVKDEYTVTKKCEVTQLNEKTFKIILSQGLNRQIRRMCAAFGYEVVRLKRVRIMDLTLDGLKTGEWRNLTQKELKSIKCLKEK